MKLFYSIVLQWSWPYKHNATITKCITRPTRWQLQEAAELKGNWRLSKCYRYFHTYTQRARDNCGGNGAPNFACPCGSLVCSSSHFKQQLLTSLWSFPHPNSWLHHVQPVPTPPSFCAPVEMFLSIHIIKPCCNQLTDEGMVEQLLAVLEWHVALLELETEYYDLCNRVTIQLTIIPHAGIQLIGNQILTFCQPRRVPSWRSNVAINQYTFWKSFDVKLCPSQTYKLNTNTGGILTKGKKVKIPNEATKWTQLQQGESDKVTIPNEATVLAQIGGFWQKTKKVTVPNEAKECWHKYNSGILTKCKKDYSP